jgi:hypothetical protein
VREAILGYDPSTPTTAPDMLKFLPVDYKRDFQFVRTIDDSFDPRLDSKMAKSHKD